MADQIKKLENRDRWLVVMIGFVILSLVFTVRSTIGLVMPMWSEEFGWSRSMISSGSSFTLVIMAIVAPFAGSAVDKYGARIFIVGGLTVLALSAFLLSIMQNKLMFYIAFSLLSGIGFGIIAMHVIVAAVSPLFNKNKGLATGVSTAGSTAGQLLVIPLVAVFIVNIGWRETYFAYSIICLVIAILCWYLLKPAPRNNVSLAEQNASVPVGEKVKPNGFWNDFKYLMKKPVFHAVFWSFSLCGFTSTGVVENHLMPYLVACGYPTLDSAWSYGFLSGFNMIGMMVAGYLSDRVNKIWLLTVIYVMRGLSFIVLMFVVGDYAALALFVVAFGLFDYSTVPVTAGIIVEHLGQKMLGITMGVLAAGHAIGAAGGAFYGGYLFDLFARYQEMWLASIMLAILAGIISLSMVFMRPKPLTINIA